MGLFKKIGNSIQGGVETTKFKADQFMRIQQVEGEIRSLHREIAGIRDKLAQTAYNMHKQGALSHKELVDLCIMIDQVNEKIAQKQTQIEAIRAEPPPIVSHTEDSQPTVSFANAEIYCTNCGTGLPPEAEFCANCGQKVAK